MGEMFGDFLLYEWQFIFFPVYWTVLLRRPRMLCNIKVLGTETLSEEVCHAPCPLLVTEPHILRQAMQNGAGGKGIFHHPYTIPPTQQQWQEMGIQIPCSPIPNICVCVLDWAQRRGFLALLQTRMGSWECYWALLFQQECTQSGNSSFLNLSQGQV